MIWAFANDHGLGCNSFPSIMALHSLNQELILILLLLLLLILLFVVNMQVIPATLQASRKKVVALLC